MGEMGMGTEAEGKGEMGIPDTYVDIVESGQRGGIVVLNAMYTMNGFYVPFVFFGFCACISIHKF